MKDLSPLLSSTLMIKKGESFLERMNDPEFKEYIQKQEALDQRFSEFFNINMSAKERANKVGNS